MIRTSLSLRQIHAALALAIVALPLVFSSAVEATTTLAVVVAGEPWKDPSTSAVGNALSVPTPPKDGIPLGWSTTEAGAVGVTWQVETVGLSPSVVASGTSPLTHPAAPGAQNWIWINANFLAATPPPKATSYRITVRAFDGGHKPLGAASAPVTVTQEAGTSTGPIFGRAGIFPSVQLMRYQEIPNYPTPNAGLKLALRNDGDQPTDPIWLYAKDSNGLMRQDKPVHIESIAKGKDRIVTLPLAAILPPATSQTPEYQQSIAWANEYRQRGGVNLVAVMDWGGPKADAPMQDHREVAAYKGSGDSCQDGKLDGDEEILADCGGSCGCCFGKDYPWTDWRGVYGYNFGNNSAFQDAAGTYDYGDLQGVFGNCSIYVWPCGALTGPVLDPFVTNYLVIVKAVTHDGRCFGFSLSARSFIAGDEQLASYPSSSGGICDTWHLKSPVDASNGSSDISPDLARMIKRRHLYQFTNEGLQTYLQARWANSSVYWVPRLKNNVPAVLGLCSHAVLVHHVRDRDDGGLDIEIYDPNVPRNPGENKMTALKASRITVQGDDSYQFDDRENPNSKGVHCSGRAASDFTVFSYADLQHPTMPSGGDSLISFGSLSGDASITQVTDAAGHPLFLPDGTINRDPATRIRAHPFYPEGVKAGDPVRFIVMDGKQAYTHHIRSTSDYEAVFVGPNYSARIQGAQAAAAEPDQVGIDPQGGGFEFATKAENKAVRGQLVVRAADKSTRSATANLTSSRDEKVRLEFDAAREAVTYRHRGAAGNFVLELWSSHSPNTPLSVRPLPVEHGDTITLKPDWRQLDQTTAMVRVTKLDGSIRDLPLR
jgi:hypothetical protein